MVLAPRQRTIAPHSSDKLILAEGEARQRHDTACDEARRVLDR